MKTRSKTLLIATAVVIATAAAFMAINPSIATKTSQEAPQIKSYPKLAGTWTYDCEFPVQRPEEIMLTCADGGMIVTDITWKTWTMTGATGTGAYSQNMCDPSCAEGVRVEASVNLKLSDLTEQGGKYYLRTLDVRTTDGKDFPWGRANGFQRDLMEFAEMMQGN